MASSDEIIKKIDRAATNPIAVARTIIADIEERANGNVELANPLNPYVHMVDMASCLGAAGIRLSKSLNRQQYPGVADSFLDIYNHLSDADYVDLFSTPSETVLTMLYHRDELLKRMVDTGAGGVKKVTIGKHTKWTVGGMDFGILYPIDIRQMAHGGLQIVYDGSEDNPMGALTSNKVNWAVRDLGRLGGGKMIEVPIPVKQFKRQSYKATLTGTAQFKKDYAFEDQFYFCRAYMATRTGEWKEISTTHSEQNFDPTNPTLQLKLLNGTLQVQMPYVYYSMGLAQTELRIDIYSTKGPVEASLKAYAPNSFNVRYADDDSIASRQFIAPLTNFITSTCYSTEMILGGSNAITLAELKNRVRTNSIGRNTTPVTPAQLEVELAKIGFGSVLAVDNITERQIMATRKLPVPRALLAMEGEESTLASANLSASAAGSTMMMLTSTLDNLATMPGVINNGERVTITPESLFRDKEGVLQIITRDEFDMITGLQGDALVTKLNSDDLLYSPLHYVLDVTQEQFSSRAYYFGEPKTDRRNFMDDNPTTGVGVNSSVFAIEKLVDGTGWRLVIETNTDESYKTLPDEKVHLQIGVEDAEGKGMVYMNGKYLGRTARNERLYEFIITTNWDVNAQNHLTLLSFDALDGVRPYPVELLSTLHVFYLAEDVRGLNYRVKWFDNEIAAFFYENEVSALYYETVDIKLGDSLEGLWNRSRTVPGSQEYQLYEEDVYDYYPENVYKEENGLRVIVDNNGVLDYVLIHAAGDPVVVDGVHQIKHRAGSTVKDAYGNPKVISETKVMRQADLFLVDANYYFVTNELDVEYARRLPETLVSWIKDYLDPFLKRAHSKTHIYLHPMATVGDVSMLVGNQRTVRMAADQELMIEFHVRSSVYNDLNVRRAMENSSTLKIAELLDKPVVSVDLIQSTLRELLGDDIISVRVTGLGGSSGYTTFTAVDGGGRLCIGHRLSLSPDGTLTVADAVAYSFINHAE